MATSKTCSTCGETKAYSEFHKGKRYADGYRGQCKLCIKESSERWRRENPEKDRENLARWYRKNREKVRERSAHWKRENPEKAREQRARYRQENPEYYQNHKEYYREYSVRYRSENQEKERERKALWYKNNRDKVYANGRRRRARILKAAGTHTAEQWQARLDYYGGKCRYCGCDGKMEVDHVIPLSKGGTNWPSNLVPACKTCNRKKGAKNFKNFI
jgi:5-methylcytosine-specific restriction endonuclease McrA